MPFNDEIIQFPTGYNMQDLLSRGNTGMILQKQGSSFVIKAPLAPVFSGEALSNELKIYQRLTQGQSCNGIAGFYGSYENCIKLEFYDGGCLTNVLAQMVHSRDLLIRLHWALQLAEAMRFVHSKNIYYWDLSCNNLVLDSCQNLKLVDFADAEFMGDFPISIHCHHGHVCPKPNAKTQDDIFKLGITFYHIVAGHLPYKEEGNTSKQLKQQYRNGEFSPLDDLPFLRDVISACWDGHYTCLDEVLSDVKTEQGLYYIDSLRYRLTVGY
jgi:serine/threonine protein kinase